MTTSQSINKDISNMSPYRLFSSPPSTEDPETQIFIQTTSIDYMNNLYGFSLKPCDLYNLCDPFSTCMNVGFKFICLCTPCYTGTYCDQIVDFCESNTNGKCTKQEICKNTNTSALTRCISIDLVENMKNLILENINNDEFVGSGNESGSLETLLSITQSSRVLVEYSTLELMQYIVASMDKEAIFNLGYSQEETIRYCEFENVRECKWNTFHHPAYGNCHSFNFNVSHRLQSRRPGAIHGLRLLLDTRYRMGNKFIKTEGFRIAFHAPGQVPFPDHEGHGVAPGYEINFELKKEINALMSTVNNKCIHHAKELYEELPYYYDDIYSFTSCDLSYRQNKTLEQCGCGNPKLTSLNFHETCPIEKKNCVKKIEMNDSLINPKCKEPCFSERYQVVTSVSKLMDLSLWNRYANDDGDLPTGLVLISSYYRNLQDFIYEEQNQYSITAFVSDIGGMLGLTLGFSLITLIELVFFLKAALHNVKKWCTKQVAQRGYFELKHL